MTTRRRPLVVRLCNWVGEVVLSVPALRRLDAAGFDLHLFGKAWAPALLEGTSWPVSVRDSKTLHATAQLRHLRRQLAVQYSTPHVAALLLTKSLSSAMEARFAGLRPAGYAYDGRSLLLSQAYSLPKFAHASHMYWHLVSRWLGADAPFPLQVDLAPSARQMTQAVELLTAQGLNERPYVMICPFSGADDHNGRKVWPGFAALVRNLNELNLAAVACPGPGEESRIAALGGVTSLLGVDLGVYAALLARAQVVIANDTGPGHLAAAVGTRLISIYGQHSIPEWAPLSPNALLLHEPQWPSAERVVTALLAIR